MLIVNHAIVAAMAIATTTLAGLISPNTYTRPSASTSVNTTSPGSNQLDVGLTARDLSVGLTCFDKCYGVMHYRVHDAANWFCSKWADRFDQGVSDY